MTIIPLRKQRLETLRIDAMDRRTREGHGGLVCGWMIPAPRRMANCRDAAALVEKDGTGIGTG